MTKKQKDIFLESEGNAWFERNHATIQERNCWANDPIVREIDACLAADALEDGGGQLLEVGCGEGRRLSWIEDNRGLQCYGVEPSEKAVARAGLSGLRVTQGTADQLDFESQTFDYLVFGFCLYLCDRDDLFEIAKEAHRVLKPNAWLVIHDFFAEMPVSREYHHLRGITSYKMDYRKLFDWHPDFTCFSHTVGAHGENVYTDDLDEWVATSVIRKKGPND
jgi:SAM-dependent methyltransferase